MVAGVRVDSGIRLGGPVSLNYDPMVAKLIVHTAASEPFTATIDKALTALSAYKISGVKLNEQQLSDILSHDDFVNNSVFTSFLGSMKPKPRAAAGPMGAASKVIVEAPFDGKIEEIKFNVGDRVEVGDAMVVLSAMKMLNNIVAEGPGIILAVLCQVGEQATGGAPLVEVEYEAQAAAAGSAGPTATRRSNSSGAGANENNSPFVREACDTSITSAVLRSGPNTLHL